MEKEAKREMYLKKLIDRKHTKQIKVITGIRSCGKSYLLNTLFYRHLIETSVQEDHIIRFAFDSAKDLALIGEDPIKMKKEKRKADPQKFIAYISKLIKDSDMYYLLLDEVQLLDCFETVLLGYLREENIDLYVTGSNAKFLSKDIITEFSNKGDEIHLSPLSFREFMEIYDGDKYEGLNEYMLYGGIPLVALKKNEEDKVAALNNLFKETYIQDILIRHRVKNQGVLEDLLNILSSSIGSLTNPDKLMRTFESMKHVSIGAATINRYIEYFEDSYLIDSAMRYDIKGKSYIETPKKYYFVDLGLRNARINFRQFERTHAMENVIYNELVARGYSVDVGVVEINEKNANGNYVRKQLEIDFVCNMGSKRYYIQSSLSMPDEEKMKQEARPLKNVDDSFKKMIVTGDMVPPHYNDDGVLIVNIYDFLLKPDYLE